MKREWKLGITIAVVVALMMVPMVLADDISNTLDASVDAVAEEMPLSENGTNGTTQLYVTPQNGDGKNGCNLTGSTTLVVSVSSNNNFVATVSPSSVTFTSCGAIATLTITPHDAGSATISVSQTSNNTGATFDLAPAVFTVIVAPPPNTPPTIVVSGVTGGESHNKGSVPAATCQVTDAEDGNSSFPATLSAVTGTYASDGIGSQTASCSYTDGGGLTASVSETYSIIDPTGPFISFTLMPATPSGLDQWYTSDVTLTWHVNDAESPNSLQLVGCVDQNIIADQLETTYSCSATSAGGSAGPVSVSIKRDATAPNPICASADGVWHANDISISCTAGDSVSGLADSADASFNLVTNVPADTETANAATISRQVCDAAGNCATAGPVSGNKIDKKAPSVSCDNSDGIWHANDVSITCTASDGGSGLASSGDAIFSLSTNVLNGSETNNASTDSRLVADAVGNESTAGPISGNMVDKKAPVVSLASRLPVANPNNWNNTDVTVTWNCSDGGSGVIANSVSQTLTGEGAAQTATGTCTDNVGNAASDTQTGINIDKTAPIISLVGGPTNGASYYYGSVPAAPTCNASDALSGLDGSCSVSGYGTTVGSHTVTASATDIAGNSASAPASYTVLAWTLNGFYQPVDMNGVYNVVRNGSTVPLKFEIFAGSTELTGPSDVKSLTYAQTSCDATATTDEIETTATGGTVLRYDATSGQFVYNWKTPSTAGKCYRVTMTTQDGSSLVAFFKLR